jgi:Cys-rich protein (TIGR01571 family)
MCAEGDILREQKQCLIAVGSAALAMYLIIIAGTTALIIMVTRRRIAMRRRYGIEGSSFGDCCLWTWCAPCALAQVGAQLHSLVTELCCIHVYISVHRQSVSCFYSFRGINDMCALGKCHANSWQGRRVTL